MSVLIPDLMVYEYIYSGLTYAANNRTCNDMYASCITQHMREKLWDQECARLVRSWCKLNEESFDVKYKDAGDSKGFNMKLRLCLVKQVEAIQLLKYVECVGYNIELSTIRKVRPVTNQEEEDYKLLREWEDAIKTAIVHSFEGYKQAKYCEY